MYVEVVETTFRLGRFQSMELDLLSGLLCFFWDVASVWRDVYVVDTLYHFVVRFLRVMSPLQD